MENKLSTDAIGIPPRSESGDVSKQNETRNTLDRSKSELTFTSDGIGCPQTNNQCQSETLKKQIHSEDTNAVRYDNYVVSSDDLLNHDYRRSQNVRNACGLGHNHPKLSEEFAVNSVSTEPKIRTPNIFKQTQDKNAPDQTLSYLKLPYEHPETHETCCAQTNIESQSETLEKTFQSANTNVIRNENTLHPNHYDGGQSVQNAGEFRHDHPKMSKEFEINSESTVPKIKYQEEVEKTPDKNALDQTPSNLRLPPEPPLEWRLNELLDDIAMELTTSEFERIKLLFTESLGEDLLKECDTCIKLFTVLKEKRYISRDNILYLNKILYILRRIDLINRTIEYCHEEGNVIHYYSFDREPGSGKRYVKIHVVADVHNYNKEALDQLRNCVAYIVCAPIEVVVISAVEPGSSFLITFTIPDIYVDVLKELLQRKVNLGRLSSLQVDIVIVDDVHFDVSGQAAEKMLTTEQYKKIRNVYEQLNDKRKELEQLNITHVQCLEELKSVKLQLERTEKVNLELTSTCSILQKFHMASNVTDAALDGFQSLMKEASDQGQNMGLIQKIIKSNTEITAAYHRRVNETKREGQILKLKERKTNDEMLLRELSLNLKSAEEILHTKYSQHTLDVVIPLNLLVTKSLVDLSKTLKAEERDILMRKISWSEDDVVKACIEADTSLLLLGLACKQTEQTQNKVDTVQFLTAYGKETGKDLLKMFNQVLEDQKKKVEDEQRNELNLNLISLLASKTKSPEEILLLYVEHFNFTVIMLDKQFVPVSATFFVNLMTQKSKGLILFLNEEECTQLMSSFTWLEQDVIKECIKADRKLLFPGLLCKQMERIGECVLPAEEIETMPNFGKVAQVLRDLSRKVSKEDQAKLMGRKRYNQRMYYCRSNTTVRRSKDMDMKQSRQTIESFL